MDAAVFRHQGEFFVSLRFAGEEIDVAGPFDCELEATLAAERAVYGGGELTPLAATFHPPVLRAHTDGLY
jgi:hypothetical protein